MRRMMLAAALCALAIATEGAPAPSATRLDPALRAMQQHPLKRYFSRATRAGRALSKPGLAAASLPQRMPCFVMGHVTQADLVSLGIPAGSEVAGIVTADLTWGDIERLSNFPGVESITLSRPARPMMDSTRVEIHADQVNGGTPPNYPPSGITGKGVVVGIVDTGIDWRHKDYQDKNGLNRILYVWDQTDLSGGNPAGYAYGHEWGAASFQAGTCTEYDDEGHGSHVAGTAAGSGRGTGNGKANYRYVGIAPEASIIAVKTDFAFSHIVDGVKYIFDKATALGKPCVVNLSLGSNYGPHDGTEPQDSALNALSGPGRIVCVSAGNSGGDSIHAEATVVNAASTTTSFHIYPYTPNFPYSQDDFVWVDGYYDANDQISVRVRAPSGYLTPAVARGNTYGVETPPFGPTYPNGQGYVYIDNGSGVTNHDLQPNHGKYNFIVQVFDNDSTKAPAGGDWQVIVTGTNITAGGHVDMWMSDYVLGGSFADIVPWRMGYNHRMEISSPSTAESTLCVGAYTTRTTWPSISGGNYTYSGTYPKKDIAYFSSTGPTADGRQRPTIAAPGFGVVSTRPADAPIDLFTVNDSVHFMNQGTSMAAPHVTGVVALILQNHPLAPPALVKAAIESTAVHDAYTGATPNGVWGYGKLNALAVYSTTALELYALAGAELEGGYEVSWTASGDAGFDGFRVERGASAAGPWTALAESPLAREARSFLDHPQPGTWYYRVGGLRGSAVQWIGPYRAEVSGTAITEARLLAPSPNPSSGVAQLSYVLPGAKASHVSLSVFDVSGRKVATLVNGNAPPGRHTVDWDGRTTSGSHAGAGLYFLRLETATGVRVQRLARLD